MTRWAAAVGYAGTRYSGWQWQAHAISVQGELQAALSKVAAHEVTVSAAGRTDAGVHAVAQVIHFDSPAPREARSWLLGVNSNLPDDIALNWVQPVREDFHARHSAVARRYRYLIHNHLARSALLENRAAWHAVALDAPAMHRAAQSLVGERDFSAFRGAQCQSTTPMRCVTDVVVRRHHDFVVLDIRANAFLHHMVRNIAGTLIEIGQGRHNEGWIAELLQARDRTRSGMNAPPQGLYLLGADYPAEFGIPAAPEFWLP